MSDDRDLEDKQRAVATGLRRSFLRTEIVATAILFKEIFAITGPLHTYLQSTKMDLSKATVLAAGTKNQLQKLKDNPDIVLSRCEAYSEAEWDSSHQSHGKEDEWQINTFNPVLDQIVTSLTT